VFFVALADVNDTALVPATIARTLGMVESPDLPLQDALKEHLSRRELLLVLDNFEQVLEAAPLVGSLLAAAPRSKVLATSRATLRVYGEQEYPVPPLVLPDPASLPPVEMLERYEAVRLFAERARAVKPGFALDGDAPAVAEICARLDGLPLAIELAAARTRLLPPKAMLKRLGDGLKLLTGGARDLPGRQQTLRGAIDWSHDLLGEEDRRLFRRMSVFSGGRTLDAMEAICGAEKDLDLYTGIESLLEKSLIRQEEGPEEEPRFVMLETIHEYAREKLQQSGEAGETKRLHAEYFLSLAEEAEPEIEGPDQVSWMDRLEAEHDNLRAALSRLLESGDVESALRIGGALLGFWGFRGYLSEGRRWLSAGRSSGEYARVGVRARALLAAGELALRQGDYPRADEDLDTSLALCREAGDRRGEARYLSLLGWIASDRNELDRAGELLEESLALSRVAGTARDVSNTLNALAGLNLFRGDYARAATLLEEGLSLAREAGDVRGIAVYTSNLALTAIMAGEYERVEVFVREAQEMFRELGEVSGLAQANGLRGFLALVGDDLDRAEQLCVEAMRVFQEMAQTSDVMHDLDILGGVAASRGEIRKAARLWGATAGYREATDYPWLPEERAMIEPYIDAARTRLDEATW
jgi:predicted ATPase